MELRIYTKIDPDLTCLGKIIGGGLPVGAYGGKKEDNGMVAPKAPFIAEPYQAIRPCSAGLAT